MGILSVALNFRRPIYPEVYLLAKLFQNIESKVLLPSAKFERRLIARLIDGDAKMQAYELRPRSDCRRNVPK